MTKELLFSVTAKDCDWSYTRGTGKGGQAKNKTSSAVHCSHRPSGAYAYSEESRSQRDNKISAFKKMVNSKKFKAWQKLECARKTGVLLSVEDKVKSEMKKIKVEIKENDKWVEINKDDGLQ